MEPFFISVAGEGAPKRPHDTLESAREEAKRLHVVLNGKRRVYVLETTEILEQTHRMH